MRVFVVVTQPARVFVLLITFLTPVHLLLLLLLRFLPLHFHLRLRSLPLSQGLLRQLLLLLLLESLLHPLLLTRLRLLLITLSANERALVNALVHISSSTSESALIVSNRANNHLILPLYCSAMCSDFVESMRVPTYVRPRHVTFTTNRPVRWGVSMGYGGQNQRAASSA